MCSSFLTKLQPKASGNGDLLLWHLGVLWPNPTIFIFVQSGCETGFNTGRLPSATDPTDPCGGPFVSFAQGIVSAGRPFQYRSCHNEEHENTRLGSRNASSVFSIFQCAESLQLRDT